MARPGRPSSAVLGGSDQYAVCSAWLLQAITSSLIDSSGLLACSTAHSRSGRKRMVEDRQLAAVGGLSYLYILPRRSAQTALRGSYNTKTLYVYYA
jgi:hypothetical protein